MGNHCLRLARSCNSLSCSLLQTHPRAAGAGDAVAIAGWVAVLCPLHGSLQQLSPAQSTAQLSQGDGQCCPLTDLSSLQRKITLPRTLLLPALSRVCSLCHSSPCHMHCSAVCTAEMLPLSYLFNEAIISLPHSWMEKSSPDV